MGRFARGWALAKASWHVLMADKELLIFTALGAVCTLIAAAILAVPAVLLALAQGVTSAEGARQSMGPAQFVLLFIFYLVTSFIAIFFNTALVGAAMQRLRGGTPRLSDGFATAVRNLGRIFVFALISATVGMVLNLLENRYRVIGQIAAALIGGAWGVITFLVIPVMVAENRNPFDAIKRSGQLLKQTWGEQLIGSGGIGLVFFLLAIPAVLPVLLSALTGSVIGLIAGGAIAAVYLGVIFLVGSALNQIFRAAVYVYADTGSVPSQFESWMLAGAFKGK